MKLQQLKYIWEVAAHGLNISATAKSLYTSQSGISKQIIMLEDELGIRIFDRSGKHLIGITAAGETIINMAEEVLNKVENMRQIADEFSNREKGTLAIATTHTQARYLLPKVINQFTKQHPDVSLHMHQGSPMQIAETVSRRKANLAIATEALEFFDDLIMLPCYYWNRSVIVRREHPLTKSDRLTLAKLAQHPIVTYTFGFTGRSQLDNAFKAHGYEPKVIFSATDADTIKTYVKLGMGIGIIASMAFDAEIDKELVALDVSHLFEPSTTKIGLRKGVPLRSFVYDFIELFAPHLNRQLIDEALTINNKQGIEQLFSHIKLPSY